jgi:DNA polymerase III alpha subunit (gram-positive type)
MNNNHLCVFDYETSSNKKNTTQILQIGAAILEPRSLKIVDEINLIAKYEDWDTVEAKALEVNHLTKEQLDEAPIIDVVWKEFTLFLKRYNKGNKWTRLIPCGHNICSFDLPITDRYAKRFGNWSKTDDDNTLFHPIYAIDTLPLMFSWFENEREPKSMSQVNLAKHLGKTDEQLSLAHNAIADVKINVEILVRFLQFQRNLMGKYRSQFKGAFKNEK